MIAPMPIHHTERLELWRARGLPGNLGTGAAGKCIRTNLEVSE